MLFNVYIPVYRRAHNVQSHGRAFDEAAERSSV